ncbi:unconventional myosin-XV-like protein, partial [Euroglyphus maynei]
NGVISGARTNEFLHEKSRIVSHNQDERNFHIFYELLAGLNDLEKEKYGLQVAEKYFYLNQGNCIEIDGKDDAEDFRFLIGAMQVLGFTNEEQDIIFRILASILHLGNVYFHRKQFRHGQEGVEIGSDAEIQWVSHLLHIPIEDIFRILTVKATETRTEIIHTALNIDQALDIRDAISKLLYMSLFTWLVHRINHIVCKNNHSISSRRPKIAVLDMFGFENLKENSFEQLCINYANELMFNHYIKCIFKLENAEYMKEKIEWKNVDYPDNQPIINLISKKPIGILPLLEDESNFPKASDNSFLEKCHYNHALNEIYSRARMNCTLEFGIKHFEEQVWYNVEGFLEKNRNILKMEIVDVLQSTKMPIMNKIFYYARELTDNGRQSQRIDGRFVTMKPRAPTVSARFQESLAHLFETVSQTNPWFIRCIRPNNDREPMKFDDKIVFTQIRQSALLETINVRKDGYPVRMKYAQFVSRYHSFINTSQLPRGTPSKEITRLIIEKYLSNDHGYRLGFSKIFLKESTETILEKERYRIMIKAVSKIQAFVRGYQARRRYNSMKRCAVRIQRAYRGYLQRRNYQTLKRGIVRLQATFRARQQRKEYEQFRTLKQKHEMERIIIENKAKHDLSLSNVGK